MPISDAYIVQYLLDGTSAVPPEIQWRHDAGETGFAAVVEGVDISLQRIYSRVGSRLTLRFEFDEQEFFITEPASRGWLSRRFSSEGERDLTRLFDRLTAAVASQSKKRRLYATEHHEQIRERISRRLLFGESGTRQSHA